MISPADAVTVGQALADAETYRRRRPGLVRRLRRVACEACDSRLDDLDQADAYAELGRQLRQEQAGELRLHPLRAPAVDRGLLRPGRQNLAPGERSRQQRGSRRARGTAQRRRGDDTRRLGEIRALLARFDWEHDDRRCALEAVERIAEGGPAHWEPSL